MFEICKLGSLKFWLIFCFMVIANFSKSQNFNLSSIAALKGTKINSNVFYISKNANCVNLQNGLALFYATKNNNPFELNCVINQEFNTLEIKFYPNPVKTISFVKFKNKPPFFDKFSLSIWSIIGENVFSSNVTSNDLYNGLELNLSKLLPGTYFLKVENSFFLEAIKIIKD